MPTWLSPNHYQQLITSQLQPVSQINTRNFLIGNKDSYNQWDYILFDEPFTKMKCGFSNERTHCIPRQIQCNKYVNGTNT